MNRPPNAGPEPAPLDSLEFEITDFASARAALDSLPAGVEKLAGQRAAEYWSSRRRRPQASDRALVGGAIDWMLSLPPSLRPHSLCERFPRVGNQLAMVWSDRPSRAALIDSLLDDRRGNRAGFPAEVRREIEQLRSV